MPQPPARAGHRADGRPNQRCRINQALVQIRLNSPKFAYSEPENSLPAPFHDTIPAPLLAANPFRIPPFGL
jgi:hypothetical protein